MVVMLVDRGVVGKISDSNISQPGSSISQLRISNVSELFRRPNHRRRVRLREVLDGVAALSSNLTKRDATFGVFVVAHLKGGKVWC
jgi:hypothetical protein